mgnify:CR=1 FL=1
MKKFIVGGSVIVIGYLFYKFSTLKKSEIKTAELTEKEKKSLKKREDLYRMYLKDDSAGFNPNQGEISLDMLNGYMYSLNRKNKR